MTTALVVLHVLVMFTAVALSQGPAFVLYSAMRRKDVPAIRAVGASLGRIGPMIGPIFGLGVLIGLAAVFASGFDPFEPWLVIAYVLTVVAILVPRFVTVPLMMRVTIAAADSPTDAPSPALTEAIRGAVGPAFGIDAAIIVLFIVDMVAKPFS